MEPPTEPQACEGCAGIARRTPCGPYHWGFRWISFRGRETCEGCAEIGGRALTDSAAGAVGGAPWGQEACEGRAEAKTCGEHRQGQKEEGG